MKRGKYHDNQIAIGKALRKFRLAKRLSQEDLAQRAGVHRNYVGDVERAEENVSLLTMLSLCEALGISLVQLAQEAERSAQVG